MGYRSLKRVLGESNIERKCRILFGLCSVLLVGIAFLAVDRIAEGLIRDVRRQTGSDRAKLYFFNIHFDVWVTAPEFKELKKEFSRDLAPERDHFRFMAPYEDEVAWTFLNPDFSLPESKAEKELLVRLMERAKARDASETESTRSDEGDESGPRNVTSSADALPLPELEKEVTLPPGEQSVADTVTAGLAFFPDWQNVVFEERYSSEDKNYYYYMPISWKKKSCRLCHASRTSEVTAGVGPDTALSSPPFRALRVSVPYSVVQSAVILTRSWLFAIGIANVGFSMFGLYAVVRYVVVKPLNHLRDVSDAIASGNTSTRAEIHTNDEFEDLATAFNKMLRHLTETQSQLQLLNEDLDARLDQLAQLNMRLYEMNRLKDDFLANMSHELRTPLNSIIGFSEVLQGIDSLNDKQKRYAQNIQKSGRILLDMINDILDLAKMEAGKMDVRPSEFRVDGIVNAQCDMVRSLTDDRNIDLTVQVMPDLPAIYQDQGKVQQILTNLLSNAIKFTPEGGRIKVTAQRDEKGLLELMVSDTGVGIPEEDREVIFEKFRQSRAVLGADGMTRAFSGTGLGLSIVRELCKLLGGEVSVESELGKGSTFRVYLPWSAPNQPQIDLRIQSKLNELNRARRDLTPSVAEA